MKSFTLLALLFTCTLCNCQKSKNEGPADLFDGKKLEGKWFLVKSIVMLRYDDGSVQNVSRDGQPDEFLQFKYSKTTSHKSEGTFTSFGLGTAGNGTWSLAQDKAELDLSFTDSPDFYVFRRIDELSENKLIVSADDKLVLLFVEVNDLNQGQTKKVVGGSVFEEYKR